ncbi:hypothetical protein I3843_14G017600 [Carya illinoinensis]|nr:hypothetical protein I3760_14G017900 [Carya illinoinensis]KAG2669084.1 hypothetical protein I3760_14G017900 [Carya illinoinensis]KAG7946038.1 hypothetical protein I3843_14G017600 [Carya illinoinensis]KAG7946039.1 hypothetical protein I3843_14G017600 [Carya illinoinensis]
MSSRRFSFFGSGGGSNAADASSNSEIQPTLKLQADKEVYRPGDPIIVSVQISNPHATEDLSISLFLERLSFEIKGIQKLDSQWFATQKPLPGSKQRRGEYVFMDCTVPAMVSNQIVSSGATKSYVVRTVLPTVIPPSYKGATVRYFYYVKSTFSGQWLILENGHSNRESVKDLTELEARIPLQVWATQKTSGLLMEEGQSDGIVPSTTIQTDIFWKEMNGDSDWVRANDLYDGIEEGYESSRDEISSVSSYNPMKEHVQRTFGSVLSLQSSSARSLSKDVPYLEGERTSLSLNVPLPRLSVAEVLHDSSADGLSPQKLAAIVSPSHQRKLLKPLSADDETTLSSSPRSETVEPLASEGFIRGRSYNIRLDDQVLLRFSPKNSDSTYYFSDMIGGTLTFFHEEGARRCLEVSITLETSETIGRQFVHPSRRNSPTITKVQSDHYEVVADLVQTSFLFSIPMDGPMSFSTPHVSVQWSLRFEFFTTPKNVDWTRYEHPLLIEGRDKSEWVLPITVHAPPPGNSAAHTRNEKSLSLEPLWVHN